MSTTALSLVTAAPASAVTACLANPIAPDHNYTVGFGAVLNVDAFPFGLLAGTQPAGKVTVETSWQTNPAPFAPSDDVSFSGNAAIRYGTPGGGRNRQGGFTYTPDPHKPYSGDDTFGYTIIDGCDNEGFGNVNILVVPTVVSSSYTTVPNKDFHVSAADGFLAHDRGIDPTSMDFAGTTAKGGFVDDGNVSNGSFVYTPPTGFSGNDSFGYTVMDLDNDHTYGGTVHITVAPLPGAPSGVRATVGKGSASVTWVSPAQPAGEPITGYQVVASPGGRSAVGTTKPLTVTGLAKGTSYTFRVRAKNGVGYGPFSPASRSVTVVQAATVARSGYWMLANNGTVFGFGSAVAFPSAGQQVVAIAPRRDGTGYWTVDAAGDVAEFGTARNLGGAPALLAGERVSTMSVTPSGNGYWLFTNRGRAFPYGNAAFHGDLSGQALNGPIVASVATPTGNGYYMVGSDGGVFSFGDARFHGSTGGIHLNRPIVGISPTSDNLGYWLVASDGGVFAFGAPFRGSMGGASLARPVNGLVAYGNGYLMVASDGGVFDFSSTPFLGSLAANPYPSPIIGIAAFTAS